MAAHLDEALFNRLYDLSEARGWVRAKNSQVISLINFCDDEPKQDLIFDLLQNFTFIDSDALNASAAALALQIEIAWGLTPNNARLVAIADLDEVDGSQILLNAIRPKLTAAAGWVTASHMTSHITGFPRILGTATPLVLVDDFLGTGSTIERKLIWCRKTLEEMGRPDVLVYVCALAAMQFAQERLNLLNVPYFAAKWLPKGISERFDGTERETRLAMMTSLEQARLPRLPKKLRWGYKKSEALFAHEPYNIPNNVFPIFWWKEDADWKPIFVRLG